MEPPPPPPPPPLAEDDSQQRFRQIAEYMVAQAVPGSQFDKEDALEDMMKDSWETLQNVKLVHHAAVQVTQGHLQAYHDAMQVQEEARCDTCNVSYKCMFVLVQLAAP